MLTDIPACHSAIWMGSMLVERWRRDHPPLSQMLTDQVWLTSNEAVEAGASRMGTSRGQRRDFFITQQSDFQAWILCSALQSIHIVRIQVYHSSILSR